MLKPIKKINLADLVVEQLKDIIIGQNMPPGYSIGTERKMCGALKVSRPILREALSTLKAQGFIEVTNNGVFVSSITPRGMIEPIEKILDEDKEKISELNEMRKILESGMAVLAIERATRQDIKKIQSTLQALEKRYLNQELGYKEDVQFHLRLGEASHNGIYIHVLQSLLDLLEKATYLYRSELVSKPGNADIMMDQHREVFDAFIAKDKSRLTEAIVSHLTWSGNELRNFNKERDSK